MKVVTLLALCLCALAALAAVGQLSAQTSTMGVGGTTTLAPGTAVPTTSSPLAPTSVSGANALPIAAATGATPTVLNVVEITQQVPAGTTTVTAFTVPAGQTLIVTDVLLTNTSTAATCGAAINRAGGSTTTTSPTTGTTTATTPSTTGTTPNATTSTTTPGTTTPTVAGTITQSDSTITGPLCLAPRTTTVLNLTTGIEFGPGQAVQLVNGPDTTATAATTATAGSIGFSLRGILVSG